MDTQEKKKTELLWQKAAVAGSIWGANEIIIGSFFHNINMPLTGTFLSMIGTMIMVATQQMWKQPGLIWRAGLICAVMKSVSPSAIILLPMLGIITEAFLLEITIRILGRNIVGYLAGGALAVLSTLFYRIVGVILIYGWNIVELFLNIYRFAVRQLRFEFFGPWELISLLVFVYILLGLMAAYAGYRIGRSAEKMNAESSVQTDLQNFDDSVFSISRTQKYSQYMAFLHFIVLISGLIFLSRFDFHYQVLFFLLYAAVCIPLYRQTLKRLAKPVIWIQFFIILTLASVFLGKPDSSENFNYPGLLAGLSMNLRALFVIFSFTALSIELRNPFIKGIILNKRFANFYVAIEMAFEILPVTLTQLNRPKEFLKNPLLSFQWLINQSGQLVTALQERQPKPPLIFFVTGEVNQGKTTYLRRLVTALQEKQIRIKGFLAQGIWNHNHKNGFELENIRDAAKITLCTETPVEDWPKFGRFYFNPKAIQTGMQWLADSAEEADLYILDEIGRFEIQNELWAPLLEILIKENRKMILVVRKKFIQAIINKWSLKDVQIISISDIPLEEAAQRIMQSIRPTHEI